MAPIPVSHFPRKRVGRNLGGPTLEYGIKHVLVVEK
jgi:hypothetical protein